MDDVISIHLFCHSLDSRLRLLLRLVKVLLEYGLSDTLLRTNGLAGLGTAGLGTDLVVLFFFFDFFRGLGTLKRRKPIVVWQYGLVVLSGLESRRTHLLGVAPSAPSWRHFHQAVYLPTLNSQ
jgi:hypothetical protein